MTNYFHKGFNSVYYPRVHCPVCKEEIYSNALICPNCRTDFTQSHNSRRTDWQSGAMKIVLLISCIVALSICFTKAPVILGLIAGLALYGFGYAVVQKIQSFKNYHHK